MLSAPKVGQIVQVWYREGARTEHHGKIGVVRISGRGRPRNHMVEVNSVKSIDCRLVVCLETMVVPAGNLKAWPPRSK